MVFLNRTLYCYSTTDLGKIKRFIFNYQIIPKTKLTLQIGFDKFDVQFVITLFYLLLKIHFIFSLSKYLFLQNWLFHVVIIL